MVLKSYECFYPECFKTGVTRGLCCNCYNWCQRLVKRGETTWEFLEQNRKVKPSRHNSKSSKKKVVFNSTHRDGKDEPKIQETGLVKVPRNWI